MFFYLTGWYYDPESRKRPYEQVETTDGNDGGVSDRCYDRRWFWSSAALLSVCTTILWAQWYTDSVFNGLSMAALMVGVVMFCICIHFGAKLFRPEWLLTSFDDHSPKHDDEE